MEATSESSLAEDNKAGAQITNSSHEEFKATISKEMSKPSLGANESSTQNPAHVTHHPTTGVSSPPSKPTEDVGKNIPGAQNSLSSDCQKTPGGAEEEEEQEKQDGLDLSEPLTFTSSRNSQRQRDRPNVILLGRGNSFSLGRSEVILLHNNRESRTRTNVRNNFRSNCNNKNDKSAEDSSVDQNRTGVDANETSNLDGSKHNKNSSHIPSSPPPISNGELAHVTLNGDVNISPHGNFDVDELEMLWRRAEMIMAEKKGDVQQVLEQFGIGEAVGEGEAEDERATEEESVWHAVQDNFQV